MRGVPGLKDGKVGMLIVCVHRIEGVNATSVLLLAAFALRFVYFNSWPMFSAFKTKKQNKNCLLFIMLTRMETV